MSMAGTSEISALVLVCGNVFAGISDALTGPAEILIRGNQIAAIERSVGRPPGARVPGCPGDRSFWSDRESRFHPHSRSPHDGCL